MTERWAKKTGKTGEGSVSATSSSLGELVLLLQETSLLDLKQE